MSNSPFCIVRFGERAGSWHQTVLVLETLEEAVVATEKAIRDRTADNWPYTYVAQDNVILENVLGPDMRGCSCAFVSDYFQSYKPVHLDISLGDLDNSI
jgi:hypothetical protein